MEDMPSSLEYMYRKALMANKLISLFATNHLLSAFFVRKTMKVYILFLDWFVIRKNSTVYQIVLLSSY